MIVECIVSVGSDEDMFGGSGEDVSLRDKSMILFDQYISFDVSCIHWRGFSVRGDFACSRCSVATGCGVMGVPAWKPSVEEHLPELCQIMLSRTFLTDKHSNTHYLTIVYPNPTH